MARTSLDRNFHLWCFLYSKRPSTEGENVICIINIILLMDCLGNEDRGMHVCDKWWIHYASYKRQKIIPHHLKGYYAKMCREKSYTCVINKTYNDFLRLDIQTRLDSIDIHVIIHDKDMSKFDMVFFIMIIMIITIIIIISLIIIIARPRPAFGRLSLGRSSRGKLLSRSL